jgi:2-iminobutanoate/2-iminopropanoate deaminase
MSITRGPVDADGFGHASPIPAAYRVGPWLLSGVITGRYQTDRSIPPTLAEQAELMFAAMRSVVEAGGGTTADIAKVTVWLADLAEKDALNKQWVAMFPDPATRPTRHALQGILEQGKLIECEFVAYIE